jgi:hypothetical protein
VLASGAKTAADAVDHLTSRLLRVPVSAPMREALVVMLRNDLGTDDLGQAATYMEDPLRLVAHLVMSTPEYQIV